jgi:AcrR family transcriptional regulator
LAFLPGVFMGIAVITDLLSKEKRISMPGKSLTPDQITEAIALREAGYTATAISARLGVSTRTLTRLFEKHSVMKGAVKQEIIAAARQELIEAVTSNERIKEEAARIVADDLAHVRILRQKIAAAYELLNPTNLEEAAVCMRAGAAAATAIKVTSDTMRHTLRTDKALDAVEEKDLPVLVVQELTWEEARRCMQAA